MSSRSRRADSNVARCRRLHTVLVELVGPLVYSSLPDGPVAFLLMHRYTYEDSRSAKLPDI